MSILPRRVRRKTPNPELEAEGKRARARMAYALRTGKVERKPCEVCGAEPVKAYYWSYARALDAIWLCGRCHGVTRSESPERPDIAAAICALVEQRFRRRGR
jgi:hypothetical protein